MSGQQEDPINNLTVENLGSALRMCHIQLHNEVIVKIIDLVELIKAKGDQTTIQDLFMLQEEWKSH